MYFVDHNQGLQPNLARDIDEGTEILRPWMRDPSPTMNEVTVSQSRCLYERTYVSNRSPPNLIDGRQRDPNVITVQNDSPDLPFPRRAPFNVG